MTDRRRGARFADEPLAHLRLRGPQDGLERHGARQPLVPGFVDDAHAAAADFADYSIGPYHVRHQSRSRNCGLTVTVLQIFDRDWHPSTVTDAPLTQLAFGEARKAMTAPTSSGRPKRPNGSSRAMNSAMP